MFHTPFNAELKYLKKNGWLEEPKKYISEKS